MRPPGFWQRYIGHDPDVCDRLHLITDRVRKITGYVGSIPGKTESTIPLNKTPLYCPPRKALVGKRVLVVDQGSSRPR